MEAAIKEVNKERIFAAAPAPCGQEISSQKYLSQAVIMRRSNNSRWH